jgi:molybdate transport system regulatory protein
MTGKRGKVDRTPGGKAHLRARVWVEREGQVGAVMTEAGADLLEQIEVCGSLSEAARRLRFAYRRAWLLVDGMNRGWAAKVVETAAGGKRGGGTQLTEYGRAVLAAYRDVQVQIEHAIDQAQGDFEAAVGARR